MEKIININGKDMKFKASGATPYLYRGKFGGDLLREMQRISDKFDPNGDLPVEILETFGKIAYIMNKQADPDQPDDWLEWLDKLEMFSIVEVLPELIELWNLNTAQTSSPKKVSAR